MDITFQSNQQKFNYRVCGMMIHDGKFLPCRTNGLPISIYPVGG